MNTRRLARLVVLALTAWIALAAPLLAQRGGGSGRTRERGGRPPQQQGPTTNRPQPVVQPYRAPAGDSLDLRRHGFSRLAVSAHPWSTVVAITVVIPGGSAQDDATLSGASWLLGQAMRDQLEASLGAGAPVTVLVDRNATRFQALAEPGSWKLVYDALMDGLFGTPAPFSSLERRRAEMLDVFRFEDGAPVREFQSELAGLVGSESPWSREPRGTAESVGRITAADLMAVHRRAYRAPDAVVSIVGALDSDPGIEVYPGAVGNGNGNGNGGGRANPPRSGGGSAWSSGRREALVRPVTSTWIGAAFPARRDVSRTVLELVVNRLQGELNPVPRDPGLFGTEIRIEDLPAGPVIVVEAAVLPEDRARWEERITRTMRTVVARYEDASFFELLRRHFRNAILVEEAAPEAEGIRIALDLLRDGRVRDLPQEIESLTSDQLGRGISALGQPRILVFGPDLGR